jgi:hypothetical protein
MTSRIRSRPMLSLAAFVACLGLVIVLSYAVYVASVAGDLPWQEDPTRIPVTPFGEIPGFSVPTPIPTATPEQ